MVITVVKVGSKTISETLDMDYAVTEIHRKTDLLTFSGGQAVAKELSWLSILL